jgi:hypothetical protein
VARGKNEPCEFDQEFITRAGIETREWVKAELGDGQRYPEKERFRLGILGSGKKPGQVVAETWPAELSDDGTVEHIIRMDEDDPKKLIAYLLMQQVRVVTGQKLTEETRRLALRVGFDDRISLKTPTPRKELALKIEELVARLGDLPFKKLRFQEGKIIGRKKKQKARLISVSCDVEDDAGGVCGCLVQITKLWLTKEGYGAPLCPMHKVPMVVAQEDEEEEKQE